MPSILVVDDEEDIRWVLTKLFKDSGYKVNTATNGLEALEKINEEIPDVVLLDIRMPKMDGLETLEKIREISQDVAVIMLTAYESVKTAIKAMKLGAYDYLAKPVDAEEIKIVIEKAINAKKLENEVVTLRRQLGKRVSFDNIVGKSYQMQKIFEQIERISSSDITVLIRGESGTGKELLAQAIHYNSARRNGPFITVDCGTLPDTLVESEIFGYEKGAFTGADRRKLGKFEMAQKGTLFLDEIGNLSFNAQSKILRALEEKKIERLGGTKSIDIDVRIVAATNVELRKMIKESKFREDLFFRLNVFSFQLPPLREKSEDIPLLAEHFLKLFSKDEDKRHTFSKDVLKYFMNYQWPGNIRELRNTVERAVLLADDVIMLEHLPATFFEQQAAPNYDAAKTLREVKQIAVSSAEKKLIMKTLRESKGNKSKAARVLEVNYKTLLEKIKEYNLE